MGRRIDLTRGDYLSVAPGEESQADIDQTLGTCPWTPPVSPSKAHAQQFLCGWPPGPTCRRAGDKLGWRVASVGPQWELAGSGLVEFRPKEQVCGFFLLFFPIFFLEFKFDYEFEFSISNKMHNQIPA
jgi:hypothetical protein